MKLNKNIKNPYSSTIYQYLNINNKSMKNKALNLKQRVKIEDENGGFVSENGGFGRGIGEEDKEACTLNVEIVYKTH